MAKYKPEEDKYKEGKYTFDEEAYRKIAEEMFGSDAFTTKNDDAHYYRLLGKRNQMAEASAKAQKARRKRIEEQNESIFGDDITDYAKEQRAKREAEANKNKDGFLSKFLDDLISPVWKDTDNDGKKIDNLLPNAYKEVDRGFDRLFNSISLGAEESLKRKIAQKANDDKLTEQLLGSYENRKFGEGAIGDFLSSGVGYLAPGLGSYKAVRGLGNLAKGTKAADKFNDLKKWQQRGLEGLGAASIFAGAETAGRELGDQLTGENKYTFKDHAERAAFELALGAGIDIALPVMKPFLKGIADRMRKGEINEQQAQQIIVETSPAASGTQMDQNLNPSKENILDGVMETIKPRVEERLVPKYQSSRYLMRWIEENTRGTYTARELETMSKTELEELASMVQRDLNPEHIAAQEAKKLGFDLSDLLNPNTKNLDDLLNLRGQREFNVYGVRNEDFDFPLMDMSVTKPAEPALNDVDKILNQRQAGTASRLVESDLNESGGNAGASLNVMGNGTQSSTSTPVDMMLDIQGRFARTEDTSDNGVLGKVWNSAIKTASDARVYLKKVENELLGNRRFKDGSGQMHMRMTNLSGATKAAESFLEERLIPAIKTLNEAGQDTSLAFKYLYSKHMRDLLNQNANYQLPRNVSANDLDDMIRAYESNPAIQSFEGEIQDLMTSLRDMLEGSGVISREQRETMERLYPNYVPSFRTQELESIDEFQQAMNHLFSGNSKQPVQSLRNGSEAPIADPIENLIKSTQNIVYASMRNHGLQGLSDMAGLQLRNGSTPVRSITARERRNYPNVIEVRTAGEPTYYAVNKDLMEAINTNAEILNPDQITGTIHRLAKLQRASITANPAFAVKQFLRDIPQAWVTSRSGFSMIRDVPMAALDILTNGRVLGDRSLLRQFEQSGAGMSSIYTYDAKSFYSIQKQAYKQENKRGYNDVPLSKSKRFLEDVLHRMRQVNTALDVVPKYAEYRSTLRKGQRNLDDQNLAPDQRALAEQDLQVEAAFNARDVMDYMKVGTGVEKVNRIIGFLNANIRGKEKMVRSFAENPMRTTIRSAVAGLVPTALAYTAYNAYGSDKQKQVIDESPDWMKDTHWLIPNPLNDTDIIRIPKPHEVMALVTTPTDWYIKSQSGKGVDMDKELTDWVLQNVWIDPSLNPLAPIQEVASNKDSFTGQQIADPDVPTHEQKDVYTSSVGEGIADLLGGIPGLKGSKLSSPQIIDHLIKGYAPVAGEKVLDTIDKKLEDFGIRQNEKPREGGYFGKDTIDLLTSPFTQFNVDGESANSKHLGEAYNVQKQLRYLKKKSEAEGLTFKYAGTYTEVNKAIKKLNDIKSEMTSIANSEDKSAQEKREKLNELIQKRNEISRKFEDSGLIEKVNELYKTASSEK